MRVEFVFLLLIAGCVSRAKESREDLVARRAVFIEEQEKLNDALHATILDRMTRDRDGVFDVLILSGGGPYGAFGAGVLHGWGDADGGRPEFDMVTGVSVGALLAPYGLLDHDDDYARVYEIFRKPGADWVSTNFLAALFGSSALFDIAGLRRDVRDEIDAELIARLAAEAREDKIALVGTTHADFGLLRIWSLGPEAEAGRTKRVHDILFASSAIPAAFPPVEIDGELYVDGNTLAPMLAGFNPDDIAEIAATWRERHPGRAFPRLRFWIIVNNKLVVDPKTTQPRWDDIAIRGLLTYSAAIVLHSLRQIHATVQIVDGGDVSAEFRYVAIPDSHPLPPLGIDLFDKELMDGLAKLGRRMGADAASWKRDAPSLWPG